MLAVPLVGRIYEWIFAPATYYSMDTALMFQQAVHNAVLDVIDCMTANKGVRSLTEDLRAGRLTWDPETLRRFAGGASVRSDPL